MLDLSLVSSSASYDLINFDLWPGIVYPERDFGLLVSRRILRCHCTRVGQILINFFGWGVFKAKFCAESENDNKNFVN